MSIRFPDLQVLFPRSAEVARVQPPGEQSTQANLHAFAMRTDAERMSRSESVVGAEQAAGASIRRRKRKDGDERKGGRGRSGGARDDDRATGRHVDIQA